VDDGYSVGVVDVYANHETDQWAARYLPMDEFDALDEALIYQQQTLLSRVAEDPHTPKKPHLQEKEVRSSSHLLVE